MSNAEFAQRYARGSAALFIGNLLSAVISSVAILVIVRLLPPDLYGTYTLVVLIPNILLNFLGLGVSSGITRYAAYHLARNEVDTAKRMTLNGVLFLLAFGVLLSAVCYGGAGLFSSFVLHRPELTGLVQFASLLVLGQTLFSSALAALLGWSLMGRMSAATVVQAFLRLVLAVGFVLAGFGVAGAVGGYSASLALAGAFAMLALWTRVKSWPKNDLSPVTQDSPLPVEGARPGFLSDIKSLLPFGVPLFLGQLSINISAQYVLAILASFSTDAAVGYYQSAVNITIAISASSSAVTQTLFPAFATLQGSNRDIGRAFNYATKYMSFFLAPIIFLLMVSATRIVGVLYQSSYSPASPYLVLLALSNVPLLFGYAVLPSFFSGIGRPRIYLAYSLAAAATQLLLAPLLGIYEGLGISGLIYSILASNVAGAIAGLLMASKYLSVRVDLRAAVSILVSAVVSYLLVYALMSSTAGFGNVLGLAFDIVLFLVVYLTLAPVTRAIDRGDLERLGVASRGLGRFRIVVEIPLRYEAFILKLVGSS